MLTKYTNLVVNIEGMTCGHCKARVEKALGSLKGVKAEVNLEEKKAVVKYSAKKITPQEIVNAVEEAGYKVVDFK